MIFSEQQISFLKQLIEFSKVKGEEINEIIKILDDIKPTDVKLSAETLFEYNKDQAWLSCLESAGVDNWQAFDFAHDIWQEEYAKDYDDDYEPDEDEDEDTDK